MDSDDEEITIHFIITIITIITIIIIIIVILDKSTSYLLNYTRNMCVYLYIISYIWYIR